MHGLVPDLAPALDISHEALMLDPKLVAQDHMERAWVDVLASGATLEKRGRDAAKDVAAVAGLALETQEGLGLGVVGVELIQQSLDVVGTERNGHAAGPSDRSRRRLRMIEGRGRPPVTDPRPVLGARAYTAADHADGQIIKAAHEDVVLFGGRELGQLLLTSRALELR